MKFVNIAFIVAFGFAGIMTAVSAIGGSVTGYTFAGWLGYSLPLALVAIAIHYARRWFKKRKSGKVI